MAAHVRYNHTDQRAIVRRFLYLQARSSLRLGARRFVREHRLSITPATLNAWVRKWRDVVEEPTRTDSTP